MPEPGHKTCGNYRQTLLCYYEEEISGEAYFYGLAEHFSERETGGRNRLASLK
jgi:hypothetical protein